jgi:hypothetical protein
MMATTSTPPETEREPIDDYHVQPHVGEITRPASHHVLAVVNALLLILIAAASLGLFWVVATLLGLI